MKRSSMVGALCSLVVFGAGCGGGGGGGGDAAVDVAVDSAVDSAVDLGFTPSPMPPISGVARSEFQADPSPIELDQGFLKWLAPGEVGIEGRTFPEPMYLLVLGDLPLGCEQPHEAIAATVRVTMYFSTNQPLPTGGIYPEVRFVDRHPTEIRRFSIHSSSGGISGTLNEVSGDLATGTVASTAARTDFEGTFQVRVCPQG